MWSTQQLIQWLFSCIRVVSPPLTILISPVSLSVLSATTWLALQWTKLPTKTIQFWRQTWWQHPESHKKVSPHVTQMVWPWMVNGKSSTHEREQEVEEDIRGQLPPYGRGWLERNTNNKAPGCPNLLQFVHLLHHHPTPFSYSCFAPSPLLRWLWG